MDFIDELRQFSTRAAKIKDLLLTEEATKNSLVLPFFQLLGYNVFDPLEFVPEYAASFGVKKDARVDYAIIVDDAPTILIECKPCNEGLDKHTGQLYPYYAATSSAKFGILTNGIVYMFFTDLNESNVMDTDPFLVFDILHINENLVPELKRFAKKTLDIGGAYSAAAELKYMGKIKNLLHILRTEPSENLVKFFMSEVYSGKRNQKAIDMFRPILRRGFVQYIEDAISETLKTAMNRQAGGQSLASSDANKDSAAALADGDDIDDDGSPMTMEEFEAFIIVKSILNDMVDVNRLAYRHTKDYMAILLDDNRNKRVCRFWFNKEQKYITTPDENKKPVRHDIAVLNDIHKYADFIREVCSRYL